MSNPAEVQTLPTKGQLAANESVIRGRVIEVKNSGQNFFTAVALPAPDQYSHPQAVEIRSKKLIGRPQEDITVRVLVGGYRRGYKDKMGQQAFATNITLDAVEA